MQNIYIRVKNAISHLIYMTQFHCQNNKFIPEVFYHWAITNFAKFFGLMQILFV